MTDQQPSFAVGTGDLSTLIPCVACTVKTFRRRWGVAIHVGCEQHYRPAAPAPASRPGRRRNS